MGLAGQKTKQRISMDPNNLNWSNDTSKFGFRMMAKMGWAPGKGLGVNEDGKQEHVKIKLKDDTLGLGAKKNQTENWLGNTDAFSRLLADLNSNASSPAATASEEEEEEQDKDSKKRKASSSDDDNDNDNDKKEKKKAKKAKKDKKDKKDKKEKKAKKEKKSSKKDKKQKDAAPTVVTPMAMRNAARAKFLKAKRMATQHDPARLNEILGIKA